MNATRGAGGAEPVVLRQDVHLQPLAMEHAAHMLEWMNDPRVRHGIGLRREPSLEATLRWITTALDDPAVRPFAIYSGARHVGNVVLDRIDTYLATARVSIYIGDHEARGGGHGRTALYLAAREGFLHGGLNKVWATVHCGNEASLGAFSRLGFSVEGVLRDEFVLDGRRTDLFYLGLLREEFVRLDVTWA